MLCKTVQSLQVVKRSKVLLYHLPKFVTHFLQTLFLVCCSSKANPGSPSDTQNMSADVQQWLWLVTWDFSKNPYSHFLLTVFSQCALYAKLRCYAIIPNMNLLSLQELAKMQGISSSSLHVQCARSSTERGCPFVLLISSFTSGCVDSIYEGVYWKGGDQKLHMIAMSLNYKSRISGDLCTVGVSPSLVSRWREVYSFWDIWGP